MEFKELMDAFAADVGMTELVAYEEDGAVCRLDINERTVGFMAVEGAGCMVIWTAVCPFPPDGGEVLLAQLLKANFMNRGIPDGALSLSDENDICAHCTIRLPVYDKAEFYSLLQRFLTAVGEWREMIDLAGRAKGLVKEVRPEEPPAWTKPGEVRFDA